MDAENHHCSHSEGKKAAVNQVPDAPPPAANRSTFICPVCKEANLSRNGLLEHCRKKHRSRVAAVCPICLAMPWGDASYISKDFVSHLNLRHKCDYETITDFGLDEQAMLQKALKASQVDEETMLQQALQASLVNVDMAAGHPDERTTEASLDDGKGALPPQAFPEGPEGMGDWEEPLSNKVPYGEMCIACDGSGCLLDCACPLCDGDGFLV